VLSGTALVAATYVLFRRATEFKTPILPKIPHGTALKVLLAPNSLTATLPQLNHVKKLLAQDYRKLAAVGNPLTERKEQLATDEHQLTHAVSQLTHAVHQLAKAGTVEAAQRAADSHQLLVTSGFALVIVTVLALLAGWFVSGKMLRPIRTITRKAQRISSTNLHERLALSGPEDELKELGDTLDDLFARLDAAFEAQRQFVANASHELRTPLTVERTLLQVALDDPDKTIAAWRSTAEEVLTYSNEQTRLIEALLILASSENGMNGHDSFDLSDVVSTTLAKIESEAQRLRIRLDESLASAPLEGDPLLVERLVVNLLNNAVRHNVLGGRIDVATGVEDGKAVLYVSNTGPVIPPTDVDRLFHPFQRLDPRRAHHGGGHGLGLSIVRAIVTAHDASIVARSNPEGGLSITVAIPQTTTAEDHLIRSTPSIDAKQ
jgi:signal transduction histidine kinase